MIVYIAGPYGGKTHDYRSYGQIDTNINTARMAAAQLAQAGIKFFCPHTHSAHFEVITPNTPAEYWYDLDMHFLDACDTILMLPGSANSRGACMELDHARAKGMQVFYNIESLIDYHAQSVL